jgi:hypothetical protein
MIFIPPLIERGLYCNHLICPSVWPSIHTFVTDILASTGRNDFIFDIWLWHGDLYRVSPFQVYHTSASCLPRDLEFFMFAVMKTFVTDISAYVFTAFSGNECWDIYKFDTNEWVGVFLARRSVQHLVLFLVNRCFHFFFY